PVSAIVTVCAAAPGEANASVGGDSRTGPGGGLGLGRGVSVGVETANGLGVGFAVGVIPGAAFPGGPPDETSHPQRAATSMKTIQPRTPGIYGKIRCLARRFPVATSCYFGCWRYARG